MVAEWARPRGCVEDEVEAMCLPEDQEDTIVARVTSCLVDKPAGGPGAVYGVDQSLTEGKDVDTSMVSVEVRIAKSARNQQET